ncbi:sarcosine oxidase subunit gamma [Paracoccus sp. (in: a-proteobacteria)]|uniref:sarcosine oxidase subunit gamma n=1 Tax=Paracoccus sp. TaxID=267 RepID=UPI0026DF0A3D|nr:sarcosine oxidase subunit gamma family protein [Paracoccus sp. (in: a-proteobacteria)]MDO5647170.1 sarcosine oxidase subunit gamma family protein [Paracoccus sp. (in: a-proteobacteria)]
MDKLAQITRITGLGMVTIRADLPRMGEALAESVGLPIPDATQITTDGKRSLGWMAPDELLLMLPVDQVADALILLEQALTGEPGLVVDMSDARVIIDITGPHTDDVITKLAPVDIARTTPGTLRRSRLAQTAAAFWRIPDGWRVIGFRSTADYLTTILHNAAAPGTELAPR